jgi:hypothetical protein
MENESEKPEEKLRQEGVEETEISEEEVYDILESLTEEVDSSVEETVEVDAAEAAAEKAAAGIELEEARIAANVAALNVLAKDMKPEVHSPNFDRMFVTVGWGALAVFSLCIILMLYVYPESAKTNLTVGVISAPNTTVPGDTFSDVTTEPEGGPDGGAPSSNGSGSGNGGGSGSGGSGSGGGPDPALPPKAPNGTVTLPADEDTDDVKIAGRLLVDGDPFERTSAWAVLTYKSGNTFSIPKSELDSSGFFLLTTSERSLPSDPLDKITVYVNREVTEKDLGTFKTKIAKLVGIQLNEYHLTGNTLLSKSVFLGEEKEDGVLLIHQNNYVVLFIALLFFISIAVGCMPLKTLNQAIAYYNLSLAYSFVFIVFMIMSVIIGFQTLHKLAEDNSGFTLGFAHIYQGQFTADEKPDWLLTFTTPQTQKTAADDAAQGEENEIAVNRGFGAPLWVIFLAVLGAGVFALLLIIKSIAEPPNTAPIDIDPKDTALEILRKRISKFKERTSEVVKHQFYLLFSPISVIVVYQLLVLSGNGGEFVTVALIALGAGVISTPLLDRGVRMASALLP